MRSISYPALVNQMRHQKPYRGSTNRYPLFGRRENRKFFLHETDSDGNPMMRIIYGYAWTSVDVTEEEYKANKNNGEDNYSEYPTHEYRNGTYVEVGKKWIKHEKHPHELGIVRPDNSFEFTRERYWQGDMMFLSAVSPGTFFTDSRRGGMVYARRRVEPPIMYPIYQGMRIDCETMKTDPSLEHKLIGMRVDRKKAKEILKPYEDFFLTTKAMMKVMPVTTFYEIGKELIQANGIETRYWLSNEDKQAMRRKFEELMNDSPVDAAAAFCLSRADSRSMGDYYHKVIRADSYHSIHDTAEMYYDRMKRYLTKEIYKANADLMKQVEFEFGRVYPPSEWAYELYVNGVEVELCS